MDEFNLTLAIVPCADCKNWFLLAVNEIDGPDPMAAFLFMGDKAKAISFLNDLAGLSRKYGASIKKTSFEAFNGKKGKENFKAR